MNYYEVLPQELIIIIFEKLSVKDILHVNTLIKLDYEVLFRLEYPAAYNNLKVLKDVDYLHLYKDIKSISKIDISFIERGYQHQMKYIYEEIINGNVSRILPDIYNTKLLSSTTIDTLYQYSIYEMYPEFYKEFIRLYQDLPDVSNKFEIIYSSLDELDNYFSIISINKLTTDHIDFNILGLYEISKTGSTDKIIKIDKDVYNHMLKNFPVPYICVFLYIICNMSKHNIFDTTFGSDLNYIRYGSLGRPTMRRLIDASVYKTVDLENYENNRYFYDYILNKIHQSLNQ